MRRLCKEKYINVKGEKGERKGGKKEREERKKERGQTRCRKGGNKERGQKRCSSAVNMCCQVLGALEHCLTDSVFRAPEGEREGGREERESEREREGSKRERDNVSE